MNIGVVGIGLIGGSIAKDLRKAGHTVIGYDNNAIHGDQAVDLEVVDRIVRIEELAKTSEIIFVSIPVHSAAKVISDLLDQISWKGVVVDTSSTKASICTSLKDHSKRGRFVAGHPLAGTEFSGPKAAVQGLFHGKKNIICEEHLTDEDAMDSALALFESIGLQSLFMDPVEHDRHMAYVSHLSHVSAFMLGSTVLEIEKDQKQIFNLASTGFQSTVRLAKSSSETWSSIFCDNSENVSCALDSYIGFLQEFKVAIDQKDSESIKELIARANEIRRVLNGMKYKAIKLS